MVLVIKGIDLSIGGLVSLSGMVFAWFGVHDYPFIFCLFVSIITGTGLGFLDGIIIAKLKPPPFVSTFVFGSLALGLTLMINNGSAIGPLNDKITFLGHNNFLAIPYAIWIMALFVVAGTIILQQMPIGNHMYALGNNELVVRQEGINIDTILIFCYTAIGLCSAQEELF